MPLSGPRAAVAMAAHRSPLAVAPHHRHPPDLPWPLAVAVLSSRRHQIRREGLERGVLERRGMGEGEQRGRRRRGEASVGGNWEEGIELIEERERGG